MMNRNCLRCHCERSEAIQASSWERLWIASAQMRLAMTGARTAAASHAPKSQISKSFQADLACPVPQQKILFFRFIRKYGCLCAARLMQRDVRVVTIREVGSGSRDRQCATSAVRRGREIAWSWRPDAGAKSLGMMTPEATVAKEPGHRGERDISVKTAAQGGPGRSGCTCGSCPVHFFRTGATGLSRGPAFPAPSHLMEGKRDAQPGPMAPRERGGTSSYQRGDRKRRCLSERATSSGGRRSTDPVV